MEESMKGKLGGEVGKEKDEMMKTIHALDTTAIQLFLSLP
jgi:hypothetical protein